MALEDDACDILLKARFGLGLSRAEAALGADLSEERLRAIEAGEEMEDGECLALAKLLGLRADALLEIARGRYAPPEAVLDPARARVTPVFAKDVGAYCYALQTPHARLAIDAGGGAQEIRRALGGPPEAVLLTHGHRDHVAALASFGVRAYAHPLLARELGAEALADGAEVFGLRVLYCQGHSPDHVAFVGDSFAFVGDALFAGSLGRARSPEDYRSLLGSGRRILSLPLQTALFCGHGPATSVAAERAHNAFSVAEG